MAITPMRCPFNNKLCEECQLFRGRHYYLSTCENYRGYIKTDKRGTRSDTPKADMAAIKKAFEPWSSDTNKITAAPELKIKIKVIDREAGTELYCTLDETKGWDWKNRFLMRMVNGKHVTSWEELTGIARYQDGKGKSELIVYLAPSFMVA